MSKNIVRDAIVFRTDLNNHWPDSAPIFRKTNYWSNRKDAIAFLGKMGGGTFSVLYVRPTAESRDGMVKCYFPELGEFDHVPRHFIFPIDDPFESPESLQDRIDTAMVKHELGVLSPWGIDPWVYDV